MTSLNSIPATTCCSISSGNQTHADDECLPFFVIGKVVKGFGRGSKELGCPTANISSEVVEQVSLSTGIYYGFAKLYDVIYMMSCSLGYNPHYNNEKKSLEVHILPDTLNDFYGADLGIAIVGKLRDEMKFPSLDDLIRAIQNDNANAMHRLSTQDFDAVKQKLQSLR
jgi:riboflavin kinase